ncbi:MAG: hypothetical protein WBW32_20460 [Luteibacter sp.]
MRKDMGDLISIYALDLVEVSSNEVLLRSSTYTIDVVADRDGVSFIYFDTTLTPVKGYNIFLFLVGKRRDKLAFAKSKQAAKSYSDFLESQVRSLSRHLHGAGQDILSGSKEWIQSYSWPAISAASEIADLILCSSDCGECLRDCVGR